MNNTVAQPSLRTRQAELVRAAILEALLTRLRSETPEEVPLDAVARDAGVSRRTLYRYFPTREALLAAAEALLVERLDLPMAIDGPEGISPSFRESTRRLERQPDLARALRHTTAGSDLRPPLRARRIEAIEAALAPLTDRLDPAQARQAAAVVAYLCSANAWVTMGDESGLSGSDIRAAVTWAIETLLADLRQRGAHPADHAD